jgi:nucleotide-binding universal stress UspA family protein
MNSASERAQPGIDPPVNHIDIAEKDTKSYLRLREILLCTDFSPASETAREIATRMSKKTGAHITVLHACEYGPMPATTEEGMDYVEGLYAEKRRSLETVVESLRGIGISADPEMIDGNPPSVILEELGRTGADVVVLGTRGTKGIERLVFGSTAEAVFRKASCPVVTVGAHCRSLDSKELSQGPILFATEFQQGASRGLEFAMELANSYGAALRCLHVLPSIHEGAGNGVIEGIMMEALKRLTNNGTACVVPPVCDVTYGSDVSHSIVEYARRHNVQAIVLGVRRKLRVASHLPPQRAYRIMMTAPCPVITVSSDQSPA